MRPPFYIRMLVGFSVCLASAVICYLSLFVFEIEPPKHERTFPSEYDPNTGLHFYYHEAVKELCLDFNEKVTRSSDFLGIDYGFDSKSLFQHNVAFPIYNVKKPDSIYVICPPEYIPFSRTNSLKRKHIYVRTDDTIHVRCYSVTGNRTRATILPDIPIIHRALSDSTFYHIKLNKASGQVEVYNYRNKMVYSSNFNNE